MTLLDEIGSPMKHGAKNRRTSKEESAKTRVLVIDSDPLMIMLLRDCLEGEKGFTVLTAESGIEGVRAAVEHAPDLILLDLRLKDMSGLEVHDRLRLDPATEKAPVVYISSFLTLRAIEKASEMGARGFIRKPFTPAEIYAKLARVLG
jgi:two-component system KDP operon response regulator KdpE